jgi:hypothetical protein
VRGVSVGGLEAGEAIVRQRLDPSERVETGHLRSERSMKNGC